MFKVKMKFAEFTAKVSIILLSLVVDAVNILLIWVPVYLLWNWLVPTIFGLPEISFIQAFGLIGLVKLLFGVNQTIVDKE